LSPELEAKSADIFREFSSGDDRAIYLNAASLTRTPISVLNWMEKKRRELQEDPTGSLVSFPSGLWAAHQLIGTEWSADPQDLFLRANITDVLNDIVFALPLSTEGGLFCSEYEYGATALLVEERARQLGRKFGFFSLGARPDASNEEILSLFEHWLRKEQPALVVFSHIATSTGRVLPVKLMADLCSRHSARVVVDGAHGPGALPFALGDWDSVDAYGGNLHKWFLGPWGTAFGWVNPRWQDRIPWQFGGWSSRATSSQWKNVNSISPEAARRAFSGTVDPVPFLALSELFQFWNQWGRESIRTIVATKTQAALSAGERQGWRSLLVGSVESPLASFHLPDGWPISRNAEFLRYLWIKERVQVMTPAASEGRIFLRLSPGLYGREVEEGVQRIAQGLRSFR
jgi:isopenicillin-N epimerase